MLLSLKGGINKGHSKEKGSDIDAEKSNYSERIRWQFRWVTIG